MPLKRARINADTRRRPSLTRNTFREPSAVSVGFGASRDTTLLTVRPKRFAARDDFPHWTELHKQDDRLADAFRRAMLRVDANFDVDIGKLTNLIDGGFRTVDRYLDAMNWSGFLADLTAEFEDYLAEAFAVGSNTPGIIPDGIVSEGILGDDGTVQTAERRRRRRPNELNLGFDKQNERAIMYARMNGADLITTIDEMYRGMVRDIIGSTLANNARDLATGRPMTPERAVRRIADLVMLDERQANAYSNFEASLDANPDIGIDRKLELLRNYRRRLVRHRAERIARTEIMDAQNAGIMATWEKGFSDGVMRREAARVVWIITPDDRLCVHCAKMIGERAEIQYGTAFETPLGTRERPPMHPMCRCTIGLSFLDPDELAAQEDELSEGVDPSDWINEYDGPKKYRAEMNAALEDIGKVHRMPAPKPGDTVQPFPTKYAARKRSGYAGMFSYRYSGPVVDIFINTTKYWDDAARAIAQRSATFYHEYGHFIDWLAGGKGRHRSHGISDRLRDYSDEMIPVLRAIQDSEHWKHLLETSNRMVDSDSAWERKIGQQIRDYYMNGAELIARSYAQYIAVKSGRDDALASLQSSDYGTAKNPNGAGFGRQWDDDDFGDIMDAWDNFFDELGLLV